MAKSTKRLITAGVVVLALAAGAVFLGAGSGGAADAESDVETDSRIVVDVETPQRGDIVVTGEFIGTVDPGQQVTVYPKVSGEVLEVLANVGDVVQEGDVLFEVDSKTLASTIAQTQAALSSASARASLSLEMAEKDRDTTVENITDGYDSTLITAEAAVESAENRLQTATANVTAARRAMKVFRDQEDTYSIIGLNDFDEQLDKLYDAVIQAELGQEAAQVALEQAQATLEATQKGTKTRTTAADDAVRMAELNANMSDQYIALQKLQDDLANYKVKSPISGVIEQKSVDAFDIASPQSPAYVISNKDALSITFSVAETAVTQMKVGDSIVVEKNGLRTSGQISEISTMVNAASGLYTVKATVKSSSVNLLSGSSVKVYVDTQKAEDGLTVPIDVLYYEGGAPYVYIVESGVVRKVFVQTGLADDERIQVTEGISASTEIITTWSPNLADGVAVALYGENESANAVERESEAAASGAKESEDVSSEEEETA